VALNSPFHDIYLSMPIEATLLPELHGLSYWGRTVHEILHEVNPLLMRWLAENQKLQAFVERKQAHLQLEAVKLEREWRGLNPLRIDGGYQARVCWLRHCKMAVREMLIDEITKSLIPSPAAA
jgi:ABC-type dipeptide/oligopeptide/nickel transport system ATPase subunit